MSDKERIADILQRHADAESQVNAAAAEKQRAADESRSIQEKANQVWSDSGLPAIQSAIRELNDELQSGGLSFNLDEHKPKSLSQVAAQNMSLPQFTIELKDGRNTLGTLEGAVDRHGELTTTMKARGQQSVGERSSLFDLIEENVRKRLVDLLDSSIPTVLPK